jgi:transglutaminase-like putative cysteine protease
MTRFRTTHITTYRYGQPVSMGQTVAHLIPRWTPNQEVRSASVQVTPWPDHRGEHVDVYGNQVIVVSIERPHAELVVEAVSEVDTAPLPPWYPGTLGAPPWDAIRPSDAVDLLAVELSLPSPHVPLTEELRDFAAPSFPPGRPVDEAAADLASRISTELVFDPGFSDVTTPVAAVLAEGRGVCQDFAHLMLAGLRSHGLAARYVSGYLETLPPPGEARLVGADASHAWVSVLVPGWGWLDCDPTNNQVPPQRHVTVAWGRDYSDVAPVRGVVFGPGTEQELFVSVDVEPLGDDA